MTGQLASYFRAHKWQRRLLAASALFLAAVATTILVYPIVADRLIIRDMGSDDLAVRTRAIGRAVARAKNKPATLRRITDALDTGNEKRFAAVLRVLRYFLLDNPDRPAMLARLSEALDTDDERRFIAVASVLRDVGKFDVPGRKPVHLDRMRAIEVERTRVEKRPEWGSEARELLTCEAVLCERDNRYIRRSLAAVADDPVSRVRRRAALLAGRLGDSRALGRFLGDDDPSVVAAAALDAGLAGMKHHLPAMKKLLRFECAGKQNQIEVRSAAALAIALLEPENAAATLAPLLRSAGDVRLRDRLLHVMAMLDTPEARTLVMDVLVKARKANTPPPAAALRAAGKLKIAAAAGDIRGVLRDALRKQPRISTCQLQAALRAADALKLPVRREVLDICRKYWGLPDELVMVTAARVLARQVDIDQPGDSDAPSRDECVRALRIAAVWQVGPTTSPASTKPAIIRTPLASASASVALWELASKGAEEFLRNAAASGTTLPGDYIAWHVWLSNRVAAYQLGLRMLPPFGAPPGRRVYDRDERAAGAMLLALSAGNDRLDEARKRVLSRLEGGQLGSETDFYLSGAYRCALLMLGDGDLDEAIFELLKVGAFPQRRAITALCAAGDKRALDWMLWNPGIDAAGIMELLLDRGIGEVLAVLAPSLPRLDADVPPDLTRWQVKILRNYYAIHRADISLGLKR